MNPNIGLTQIVQTIAGSVALGIFTGLIAYTYAIRYGSNNYRQCRECTESQCSLKNPLYDTTNCRFISSNIPINPYYPEHYPELTKELNKENATEITEKIKITTETEADDLENAVQHYIYDDPIYRRQEEESDKSDGSNYGLEDQIRESTIIRRNAIVDEQKDYSNSPMKSFLYDSNYEGIQNQVSQ